MMTAMLELILVYIYSVLLFTFFYDQYYNDDILFTDDQFERGDTLARSLFHAYISTLNFGLRAGGGIGAYFRWGKSFRRSERIVFFNICILSF